MKTGVASLTPADIERLLREHSFMVKTLHDIGYRLTRVQLVGAARDALRAILDNAVDNDGEYGG